MVPSSHPSNIMPLDSPHPSSSPASNPEIDLLKLKSRYDALLPKYGFLWRSMANKRMSRTEPKPTAAPQKSGKSGKENETPSLNANPAKSEAAASKSGKPSPSFLDAIQNKQPISLSIHDSCDQDCNCSEPIVEIDEDDSVYALNELVDSDDEGKIENGKESGKPETGVVDDADVEFDDDFSDSDDEVVVTTRRKKTYVIESDESVVSSDEESGVTLSEREEISIGSNVDQSNFDAETVDGDVVKEEEASPTSAASKPSPNVSNENKSDEISAASEVEWVELSSDDEETEEIPQNRVNTVVILSSDEESESEGTSDDEEHSVYSIGDSDSEESVDSVFSKSDRMSDMGSSRSWTNSSVDSDESKEGPSNITTKKINRTKDSQSNGAVQTNKSQLNSKSAALAFRKKRDAILTSTFSEFNNLAFQNVLSSVQVTWSNKLNTTAGITRMRGKLNHPNSRVATIELATKVIDNEERLRSTLLHEMCHAAAWLVDGVHKPPHGKFFKKWAGISMRKIGDVEVTTTHDYQIAYKYAWACTSKSCDVIIKRHSRSVDPTKHCCGRCKSKLIEIEVQNSNTHSKDGYTPKKTRKASPYALFVKEQTPIVRQWLAYERNCSSSEVSQADVMKECGRLWRSEKTARSKENASLDDGLEGMAEKLTGMSLNASSP